jgi:uncharacterized protein (TIGR02679 family)
MSQGEQRVVSYLVLFAAAAAHFTSVGEVYPYAPRLIAPIVCTMGNPTTVTLTLLDAITASEQVVLAYHGDFDWAGLAISGRVMARYSTRPWQFTAEHYRAAVDQAASRGVPHQPLTGRTTGFPGDPDLAEVMARLGIAVHEEALIEGLLRDLRSGG